MMPRPPLFTFPNIIKAGVLLASAAPWAFLGNLFHN